jgi:tripartite-type tricarboxylate transporter receptor subunit TctC
VQYLKNSPSKANYGSSGTGAAPHLVAASFLAAAQAEATHIPYRGSGPMMIDLIAGNVQFAIDTAASASAQINGGKVRGLAVTSTKRAGSLPDVPTMIEGGVPLDITIWYGLVAPAGVPAPVVQQLHDATKRAMSTPEVREAFAKMGIEPDNKSVAEFGEMIKQDKQRWTTLAEKAGVAPE